MKSEVAKDLDSSFNHMQWTGEEYLFDELVSSHKGLIHKEGKVHSKDLMFWVGYTYRYWSFYSGETSNQIYKIANADTMFRNYMMFHAFDPVVAIENLKEIHRQKKPETCYNLEYQKGRTETNELYASFLCMCFFQWRRKKNVTISRKKRGIMLRDVE